MKHRAESRFFFIVVLLFLLMLPLGTSLHAQTDNERVEGDYGDAPDNLFTNYTSVDPLGQATFPSSSDDEADAAEQGFVVHRAPEDRVFLGETVTVEENAILIDRDFDDGWIPSSFSACSTQQIAVLITIPETAPEGPIYFNALFDWNHNGSWNGSDGCPVEVLTPPPGELPSPTGTSAPEWAIQNIRLDQPPYELKPGFSGGVIFPPFLTGQLGGEMWVRFTITTEPVNDPSNRSQSLNNAGWDGRGDFDFGETEDYFTCLIAEGQSLPGCPRSAPDLSNANPVLSLDEVNALVNQPQPDSDDPDDPTPPTPGDPTPPNPPGGPDDPGTPQLIPEADLSLDKTVNDTTPNVGDIITFAIVVRNDGPDPATGVSATDPLPTGLDFVSSSTFNGGYDSGSGLWAIGDLTVGDEARLDIVARVVGSGSLTNEAEVFSSDVADPDSVPGNGTAGEDDIASVGMTVPPAADLNLTKTTDNPEPGLGETVNFTITLTNEGPDPATNITVNEALPPELSFVTATPSQGTFNGTTWSLSNLAVGASATLQVQTTLVSGGSGITNTVEVMTSDLFDPDSTPGNGVVGEDDLDTLTVNVVSDLSMTKTDSPDPVSVGNTLIWTLSITNNGPSDADNVIVSDSLPSGVIFNSATPSQGSCNESGGTVTCNLGMVSNGNTETVTIDVQVSPSFASTSLSNSASVTSDNVDPNPGDNSDSEDTVVEGSDLSITKVDVADPVAVGTNLQWTLTVQNDGPSNASNVQVVDTLPSGTTFVSAVPSQGGCSPVAGVTCNLGTLNNGASATVDITVLVDAGFAGTSMTNTVTVSSDNADTNPGNNSDTENTTIIHPAIEIIKLPDNQTLPIGGTANWTITVNNIGDVLLNNVTVTDAMAPNCDNNLGTMGVGGSTTYSCDLTNVTQDFTNVADVVGTAPSGDNVTDDDDAFVDILPAITVIKSVNPASLPEPGGVFSFTVRVNNDSNEAITLTSLVDDIHGDLDGQGTCSMPQAIGIGGFYQCFFDATVNGNAGFSETDTVTATAEDDDGNSVNDNDTATLDITDVASAGINVTKTATPTSINEPGGSITFDLQIDNPSSVDTVTINSIVDDIHGDLDGQGTCSVPQVIAPGGNYQCSFSALVTGNAGDSETDTITADGVDDDGAAVSDNDSATVDILDVASAGITVTKTATPTSINELGGSITFDLQIDNPSTVDSVTITSIVDDIHGDLNGQGTCSVPQVIAAGGNYQCSFSALVTGNAGDSETDTITASGIDDDGAPVSNNDSATVDILDVASAGITVTKTATPTTVNEPGGAVTFDVQIDNPSSVDAVTITSLVDDIHGDLDGQGTCSVPQVIAAGGNYQCAFTANVNGNAGDSETDTITATGTDDDGAPVTDNDTATVDILDILPSITLTKTANPTTINEPGGPVTFTVRIDNNVAVESVDITSLVDDIHGNLDGQGTCAVPQTIAASGFYECSFTGNVTGNAGDSETDTITADGADDDGNPVNDNDTATVDILDVLPSITVTKTASPTTINEPGGSITFTLRIDNNVSAESVNITSIVDDIHGNLDGQGTCAVPQTIAASGFYQCTFSANVTGNAGDSETDTITADGADDDGNPVSDNDSATVDIVDVPSAGITVTKTASPTSVNEPGGSVTFTARIDNPSTADSVTITSLVDDIHGDLNTQGTCAVPQIIAAGDFYECSFSALVTGNAGDSETDTITASGVDDDGVPVTDNDSATVNVVDVPSAGITVTKTANPTTLNEPGGPVVFTMRIDNPSTADAVTINSIVDDIHGNLDGQGDCAVPQLIAAGGFYQCSFIANVTGAPGTSETDTITADGVDDDGTPVSDNDSATVDILDVLPNITLTKTANPTQVEEPGGPVTFTVRLDNNVTEESVNITSLVDDIHGNLNGQGDCFVPQSIGPGGFYQCQFTVNVNGTAGTSETDTITADGADDEGNPVSANDSATVDIIEVVADLSITKTDSMDPVLVGSTFSWTLNVTNNGPSNGINVVVSDSLPSGVTLQSINSAGWDSCSGTVNITCNLAFLAPGPAPAIVLNVQVDPGFMGSQLVNTATVSSDSTDNNPGDNSDTETTNVDGGVDLSITKTDNPDPVLAGNQLTYTLSVANAGPATATNLTVSDTLLSELTLVSASGTGWSCSDDAPASPTTVTCTLATLPVGAANPIVIVSTVDPSTTNGTALSNTATVTSTNIELNPGDESDTEPTNVGTEADLSLVKNDVSDPVEAGTNVTWTLSVTNNGPSDAQGVTVTDTLPTEVTLVSASGTGWSCSDDAPAVPTTVTCTDASLSPGPANPITIVATVDPSTANGTTLNNTASATTTTTDPNPGNNSDGETTTIDTAADLTIVKTDLPDPAVAGQNLFFFINVTNNGPSDAQTVVVSDPLPTEVSFISASPTQGTCMHDGSPTGGLVTCNLNTMGDGDVVTITITTRVDASFTGTSVSNTANVSSGTTDPNPGNDDTETTTITQEADISVGKIDNPDPVVAGEVLTWTITIDNNGPSDAQNVDMTDVLPSGVTLVGGSVTPSQGSCVEGSTITCSIGTVPAQDSATVVFSVIVDSDFPGSSISNSATVTTSTTDPTPGNNTGSATTTVNKVSDLILTMTDNPDPVNAGQQLVYVVTVNNSGPSEATNVNVFDSLPSGVTFNSAVPSQGSCSGTSSISCNLGSISSGGNATITITVTVNPGFSGVLTNTALVTTTSTDPNAGNDSDSENTTVN